MIEPYERSLVEDIDLLRMLKAIYVGKWLILLTIIIFLGLGLFFHYGLPKKYTASIVVEPVNTRSNSSLSRIAGQFGGLATIAGIDLGRNSVDRADVAIQVLRSWDFQEKFIKKYGIKNELLYGKGWDSSKDTILYKNSDNQGDLGSYELYQLLNDRISISRDGKTGLITISVNYYSPKIAKEWVTKIFESINTHFKSLDRKDAEESISFLSTQIQETKVVEMRNVFYSLIEEKTRMLMLSEISDEYVFKIVSPAMLPEQPSGMGLLSVIIITFSLGFMFPTFVLLVVEFFQSKNRTI